jgi:adenosylmethionine-8-amino-7-oxononanoate transaminase
MQDWLEKDLTYNWHPYTQMMNLRDNPPLLITRAAGRYLYDVDGKAYYDSNSSWWCNVHGHCHPKIREAVEKQMRILDHIMFGSIAHIPAIELAEKLVSITPPGLDRVFYSDNGSTAVEVALKMSVQYWRNTDHPEKCRIISLDAGYHGDTVGCMSVSNVELFRGAFDPLMFQAITAPTPHCDDCILPCKNKSFGRLHWDTDDENPPCLASMERLLIQHADITAAIILEPLLMGAGGMLIYPPAYLRGVAQLAKKYNVHLILDEVATGFGRTGKMFACEYAGITPDFMCLSKGLTGGTMPFAATMTTNSIYEGFLSTDSSKTFFHGHTYTANPIGCAIALASLQLFHDDNLLDNVNTLTPLLLKKMQNFADIPIIKNIRVIGTVAAFDVIHPDYAELLKKIYRAGLANGLIMRPMGKASYLFLPQSATIDEVEMVFEKLDGVYREIF